MRTIFLTFAVLAGLVAPAEQALAQRSSDPNFGHFYMGRQQITITDDSPIINDQRTMQGPGGGGGNGGLPAGPIPLPKAGWQPYSSTIPGVQTALPKVVNGVPPKMPAAPAGPKAMQGNAGALKAKAPAKPAGPVTVKSYNAYKGYGGSLPGSTGAGASGGPSYSSNTAVQGSVLHWARKKAGY